MLGDTWSVNKRVEKGHMSRRQHLRKLLLRSAALGGAVFVLAFCYDLLLVGGKDGFVSWGLLFWPVNFVGMVCGWDVLTETRLLWRGLQIAGVVTYVLLCFMLVLTFSRLVNKLNIRGGRVSPQE